MSEARVILRANGASSTSWGIICIDFGRHETSRGDRWVTWRSNRAFAVVAAMLTTQSRVTTSQLVDHVFMADPDGGPDDADIVVRRIIGRGRFKARLAILGLSLDRERGRGWRLAIHDALPCTRTRNLRPTGPRGHHYLRWVEMAA